MVRPEKIPIDALARPHSLKVPGTISKSPCLQAFQLKTKTTGRCLDIDPRWVRYLDGDDKIFCAHCHLPMGDFGYNGIDGKGPRMHGECLAQQMLKEMKDENLHRQQQDSLEKSVRREEYGIGWKVEQISHNIRLQQKAKDLLPHYGMCCVVLQKGSNSVHLAPTLEASAAINLEYLSIALQVQRKEGREPFFSLDPVERTGCDNIDFDKHSKQIKRFEPEWLAGTSAGEVMFQADYHLKELSMGECDQPVVGMKSCLDYSEEAHTSKKWTAREWFMIRHAEMQLSEDNVLIPNVKMGVEAREQVYSECGLVDAPITRSSHPMVKYAESFTKNFDLIAERTSVVYHLRELAKASVLAKFLIDSNIVVEETWFNLMGEVEEASAMEIPQLWNERVHFNIRMLDGEILGAAQGINTHMHGVYGGVNMNLAQFDISKIAPRRVVAVTMPSRTGFITGGQVERRYPTATIPLASIPTRPSAALLPPALSAAPLLSGLIMQEAPAASLSGSNIVPPRGVDLCLNQFCLDLPMQNAKGNLVNELGNPDVCADIAKAFWACVDDGKQSQLDEEDVILFKKVFNPSMCDRRSEGDNFVPPDCSLPTISRLRSLLNDEEELRQKRKDHFFSADFSETNPGSLFPSSWTAPIAITTTGSPCANLLARSDCIEQAKVLTTTPPVFQKRTEDGMTFSIYRVGSIEARTTQTHDGETTIGAVFCRREATNGTLESTAAGSDRVIKVSQYVENAQIGAGADKRFAYKHFSVVVTESGHTIVTEQTDDTVTWEIDAADLVDRISLAKVVRSASCCQSGATVQDLKNHRAKALERNTCDRSKGKSQVYSTGVYIIAMGGIEGALKEVERLQKAWHRVGES